MLTEQKELSEMPPNFWEELADDPAVFPRALIIDGPSLIDIMLNVETKQILLKFCQLCKAIHYSLERIVRTFVHD